jgi:hypothetical protein
MALQKTATRGLTKEELAIAKCVLSHMHDNLWVDM